MAVEIAGEVRSTKPLVECSDFQDFVLQVKGDPTCKRAGCHGRGYIGAERKPDGTIILMLCPCGHFGETPFVKMAKAFEGAWKQSDQTMSENFKLLTDVVTSVNEASMVRLNERLHSLDEMQRSLHEITECKIMQELAIIKRYTFWGGVLYLWERWKSFVDGAKSAE